MNHKRTSPKTPTDIQQIKDINLLLLEEAKQIRVLVQKVCGHEYQVATRWVWQPDGGISEKHYVFFE